MMDLILRQNVPSLGQAGDLVRVKPGYARNFLLPRGLAFEATEGNKKRIAAETKARDAVAAAERGAAEAFALQLQAVSLSFTAKAGEDGKLFGSITTSDVAEALANKGLTVDKRKIELDHPLKQLGSHTVTIRLHQDVQADVKVHVTAEG